MQLLCSSSSFSCTGNRQRRFCSRSLDAQSTLDQNRKRMTTLIHTDQNLSTFNVTPKRNLEGFFGCRVCVCHRLCALDLQASLAPCFPGLTITSLKHESSCILLCIDREERERLFFFRAEWVSQIEESLSGCTGLEKGAENCTAMG